MSQGFIAPAGLDSTQNLTPLLRDRGGWIKSVDGYNWKDESTLDLMFDEDDNSVSFPVVCRFYDDLRIKLPICIRTIWPLIASNVDRFGDFSNQFSLARIKSNTQPGAIIQPQFPVLKVIYLRQPRMLV